MCLHLRIFFSFPSILEMSYLNRWQTLLLQLIFEFCLIWLWRWTVTWMRLWDAVSMPIRFLRLVLVLHEMSFFWSLLWDNFLFWMSELLWLWKAQVSKGSLILEIRDHARKSFVDLLNYFFSVPWLPSIEKLGFTLTICGCLIILCHLHDLIKYDRVSFHKFHDFSLFKLFD